MKKQEILRAIDHAYEYHVEQVEKVTQLIEGKKVKNPTPRMKNECEFGSWLYGDASRIKGLLGIHFYVTMELIHEYWHIQYEKIHEIYYNEESSVFVKLFRNRRKLSRAEYKEVQNYYEELHKATDDLLEALSASKRRILALKEYIFKNDD